MAITQQSITSAFGSVLTSKLREWLKQNPVEQTNQGNVFLDHVYKSNRMSLNDSNRYDCPVSFIETNKGDFYDGADVTSTAGSDDVTIAQYPSASLTEPVKLLRKDMKKTANGIFNLLVHKTRQARLRARNLLADSLMNYTQTNSKHVLGVPQIIQEAPTTDGAVGGLDAANDAGWGNQFKDASDTFANSVGDFDEVSYECTRAGLTDWDYIVTTPTVAYGMKAEARSNQAIDVGVKPASGRFADSGYTGITFEGKPVLIDRHLEDGRSGGDSAFFMNDDDIFLNVDPSDDFVIEGPFPLQSGGQHGALWNIYWTGALVACGRSGSGVVFDITG